MITLTAHLGTLSLDSPEEHRLNSVFFLTHMVKYADSTLSLKKIRFMMPRHFFKCRTSKNVGEAIIMIKLLECET